MAYTAESRGGAFTAGASGMPGGSTYQLQTLQQQNVPPMFTGGGILAVQNQTKSGLGQSAENYRLNNYPDYIRRTQAAGAYGGNPQYMNM